jgi:hypothetical protein
VRGESVATLASNVARSVVVIANSILDLRNPYNVSIPVQLFLLVRSTHVQVQHLAISSVSADGCRHDDKLVLCDKVADAAFLARRLCSGMGLDVEFEGEAEGQQCQ